MVHLLQGKYLLQSAAASIVGRQVFPVPGFLLPDVPLADVQSEAPRSTSFVSLQSLPRRSRQKHLFICARSADQHEMVFSLLQVIQYAKHLGVKTINLVRPAP